MNEDNLFEIKKRLKDSLPLEPDSLADREPDFYVDDVGGKDDGIREEWPIDGEIRGKVTEVRDRAEDVAKIQAKRYADMLKAGMKPGEAARALKTTKRKLMSQPAVRKKITQVIESYTLPADVRKLLVRASLNKAVIHTMDSDDPKDMQTLLKAADSIARDPEVNIAQPATNVQVNVGIQDPALKNLLETFEPPQLPPAEDEEGESPAE